MRETEMRYDDNVSIHIEPKQKNSFIAAGLHDVLCHLKSCQLLHICMKNPIWKGLQLVLAPECSM